MSTLLRMIGAALALWGAGVLFVGIQNGEPGYIAGSLFLGGLAFVAFRGAGEGRDDVRAKLRDRETVEERLARLRDLHARGVVSTEDFEEQKSRILGEL